jgi:hypothetical protein
MIWPQILSIIWLGIVALWLISAFRKAGPDPDTIQIVLDGRRAAVPKAGLTGRALHYLAGVGPDRDLWLVLPCGFDDLRVLADATHYPLKKGARLYTAPTLSDRRSTVT